MCIEMDKRSCCARCNRVNEFGGGELKKDTGPQNSNSRTELKKSYKNKILR